MQRETDIEKFIGSEVRKEGCLWYKFTSPGNAGVPDRILILPGGTIFFVELKDERGVLSKMQKAQIQRLTSRHARVIVVKGQKEAETLLSVVRLMIEEGR